jgi:SAM-dependent methyltransferase
MAAEGRKNLEREGALTVVDRLGRLLERWPYLKALAFVAENAFWAVKLRVGWIRTRWATHRALPLEESIAYIERVFADYLRYGEVPHFYGNVAELGPGDNAGVALLIRKDGGEHVDLIERFHPYVDEIQQQQIYQALSERHGLDTYRLGSYHNRMASAGITWNFTSAEKFLAACPNDTYDFMVSRAVLEHLANPLGALRSMSRALRPGGLLLHEVDLRDHGHFSRSNDEFTWLGFPSWLWTFMTNQSGRPNRILAHRYRGLLEGLRRTEGIEFQLLVKSLVGGQEIDPGVPFEAIPTAQRERAVALVESQRSRFAPEFQNVNAVDLAITTVFIVVRKPEVGQ